MINFKLIVSKNEINKKKKKKTGYCNYFALKVLEVKLVGSVVEWLKHRTDDFAFELLRAIFSKNFCLFQQEITF